MHPFAMLSLSQRWVLLAILVAGTILFAIRLGRMDEPLKTPAAPQGILSYEFAWRASVADRILASWGVHRETARRQTVLDFGFLIAYPLMFSLACAMLATAGHGKEAIGLYIAWAVLLAAPLDAVENVALLRMLDVGGSDGMARLAGLCAGAKFVLILAASGYLLLQGSAVAIGRLRA